MLQNYLSGQNILLSTKNNSELVDVSELIHLLALHCFRHETRTFLWGGSLV